MGYPDRLTQFSDREIIENILMPGIPRRKGEEQLFNKFSYFIREGCNKHHLTEEESFDAYSDTILAAVEKIAIGAFEGRSSLKTYLFKIYNNKCVDLIRKNSTNKSSIHRTESITDMLLYLSDSARSVVQKLIDRTEWENLKTKLLELGDNCKELLWQWADGYSDKEIAVALDYKTGNVAKVSRLRCLEKLRKQYKNIL